MSEPEPQKVEVPILLNRTQVRHMSRPHQKGKKTQAHLTKEQARNVLWTRLHESRP